MTQRMLARHEVERVTGLSCTSLYRYMHAGTFPKPVKLSAGGQRVGWPESEIQTWIAERIAERDAAVA